MSHVPEWIQDVNKITKEDLQPGPLDVTRCLPPGFFVLRWEFTVVDPRVHNIYHTDNRITKTATDWFILHNQHELCMQVDTTSDIDF